MHKLKFTQEKTETMAEMLSDQELETRQINKTQRDVEKPLDACEEIVGRGTTQQRKVRKERRGKKAKKKRAVTNAGRAHWGDSRMQRGPTGMHPCT